MFLCVCGLTWHIAEQFPRAETVVRGGSLNLSYAFYFLSAFGFALQNLYVLLVLEKERGLKDQLMMMGLSRGIYWTSWWITQLAMNFVTVFIVIAVGYISAIFRHSDPVLLFLAFYLYARACCLCICVCCLCTRLLQS